MTLSLLKHKLYLEVWFLLGVLAPGAISLSDIQMIKTYKKQNSGNMWTSQDDCTVACYEELMYLGSEVHDS